MVRAIASGAGGPGFKTASAQNCSKAAKVHSEKGMGTQLSSELGKMNRVGMCLTAILSLHVQVGSKDAFSLHRTSGPPRTGHSRLTTNRPEIE